MINRLLTFSLAVVAFCFPSFASAQFPACTDNNARPKACHVQVLRSIFAGGLVSTVGGPGAFKENEEFTLTFNPVTDNGLAQWSTLWGESVECATPGNKNCSSIVLSPSASCKRYSRSCNYKGTGGEPGKNYLVVFTYNFGSACRGPCGEDPYYISNSDDYAWATFEIAVTGKEKPGIAGGGSHLAAENL